MDTDERQEASVVMSGREGIRRSRLPEQVEHMHGRNFGWEKFQKRAKARLSRRIARDALMRLEEPENIEGKYRGYTS